MSVAETFNPTSISLSARAVHKVRDLVEEEENDELKLRVFITGGGCSGFQYGMTWEKDEKPNDNLHDFSGLKVFVDPLSAMYLDDVVDLLPRNRRRRARRS